MNGMICGKTVYALTVGAAIQSWKAKSGITTNPGISSNTNVLMLMAGVGR